MLYDILLDIGGTGIKGGYFSVNKNLISQSYDFISDSDKKCTTIIRHFTSICRQIWDVIDDVDKKIRYIKMAFPGPFDYEKGVSRMKGLAKYESLYDISISNEMIRLSTQEHHKFIPKNKCDFKFINDVEAYALGVMNEKNLFQGYRVIYLCIGTGSGSAYSVDGKISKDEAQGIPENGWIYPIPFKDSIIDDYISARGISQLAKKYCNKVISPLELSEMVRFGNEHALKAYLEFGCNLNDALLPLVKNFGANTFVIGGNISHSSEIFLSPINEGCKVLGTEIIIESNTSKLVMMGLTKV